MDVDPARLIRLEVLEGILKATDLVIVDLTNNRAVTPGTPLNRRTREALYTLPKWRLRDLAQIAHAMGRMPRAELDEITRQCSFTDAIPLPKDLR